MKRITTIITVLALLAMCLPAWSTEGSLTFVDDYAGDNTKGRFVMEAESYANRTSAADGGWWEVDGANHEFIEGPSAGQVAPTATGGARENYMEVLGPTIGGVPPIDASYTGPFMDYKILVETTDSYRLYVRWRGRTGGTDSLYAYILKPDGTLLTDAGPNYFLFHQYRSSWIWDNRGVKNTVHCAGAGFPHVAVWTISDPGIYTIRIAQRETESALDALLFQTSNLSAPSGHGPPQSQLHGELQALEITGPDEVAENHQTQYHAIAHYDNNSTQDVTASALWSVEPVTLADINAGLLTTEPISYYHEDIKIYALYTEDSNTVDAEKAVTVHAVCSTGTTLEFDGVNDQVIVQDDPSLRPPVITLAAWIYPDDVSHHFQLIGKWLPAENEYIFDNKNNHDGLRLASEFGGGPFTQLYSRDAVLTPGVWQHVAVTWDAATCIFYVNGENAGEDGNASGALADMAHPVYIGFSQYGGRPFDGRMDEVAIFNRALSAEEIQMLMHTRPDGDEPNLVAYWNLDEGEGQVAHDLSANANNGYLGSDPCAPDNKDPVWVDSDAPVEFCTLGGFVERYLSEALESKLNSLEEIDGAMTMEKIALDALDRAFRENDHDDLRKRDVVITKQKIHSAMRHQQQSVDALEKGITKVEESLSTMDGD
jgi:hypothetical protein